MFTRSTRDFGIWKGDHPSHRRHTGSPTSAVVTALGICAFVCWLVFFLSLKIRGEFFVLENEGLKLAKVDAHAVPLKEERPAALRFGVRKHATPGEGLTLLFESGRVFRFPREEAELKALIEERTGEMERTGLLTLVANPALSRAQIWPEAGIPPSDMRALMGFLTSLGFDDFDVAMEVN